MTKYDLDYQKSPHYGYACDIARDSRVKVVTKLLDKCDKQAEEIKRLNKWQEYVRMNSKDAAHYADEALSAPQQEQE